MNDQIIAISDKVALYGSYATTIAGLVVAYFIFDMTLDWAIHLVGVAQENAEHEKARAYAKKIYLRQQYYRGYRNGDYK